MGQNFAHRENYVKRNFACASQRLYGRNFAVPDDRGMRKPPPNLPHYIRAWRAHRRLTLEQVANILDLATNTLSDKELGKRPVTTAELAKLAKVYDCEPWMLLAVDPASPALDQLQKVVAAFKEMSPEEVNAWLAVASAMQSRRK